MKKNLIKSILILTIVACLLSSTCIYAYAYEEIPITDNGTYQTGYSNHVEYTCNNSVRGFSEGNCVHNAQDDIYVYAYAKGNSYNGNVYSKSVEVSTRSFGDNAVTYCDITQNATIEWNEQVDFTNSSASANHVYIYAGAEYSSDRWYVEYHYNFNQRTMFGGEYSN